jgi:hypothetical protein
MPEFRKASGLCSGAPRNWHKNITLMGALGPDGMGADMSVEGATDAAAVKTYGEPYFLAHLQKGQVEWSGTLRGSTRV